MPSSLLVNLRRTASTERISMTWVGDQTGETYSSRGRTYVLNAKIRLLVSRDKKERLIRAARWWTRLTISLIWDLNFKFGSNWTPKSLVMEVVWIRLLERRNSVWQGFGPSSMMLHLEYDIPICQVAAQVWILSRHDWKLTMSVGRAISEFDVIRKKFDSDMVLYWLSRLYH